MNAHLTIQSMLAIQAHIEACDDVTDEEVERAIVEGEAQAAIIEAMPADSLENVICQIKVLAWRHGGTIILGNEDDPDLAQASKLLNALPALLENQITARVA